MVFDIVIKDWTHPSEYYNPEFDVKTDHGTVRFSVTRGSCT